MYKDVGGVTFMKKIKIHEMAGFIFLFFIVIMTSGCSSSSGNDAPAVSLCTDADHNGIPDDLEAGVARLLSAADDGSVDSGDEEAFEEALASFGESLPYSNRVRKIQQEIANLNAEYEALPAEEKTGENYEVLQSELIRLFGELEEDETFVQIHDYMEDILENSVSGEAATEDFSGNEKWDSLKRGDVMLIKSPDLDAHQYLYVWKYSHAGVYNGNDLVYESVSAGVALRPLSKWKRAGLFTGLGRSKVKTETEVCAKLDELIGEFGDENATAYNYLIPLKNSCNNWLWFKDSPRYREKALYCSQLVWWLHNNLLGYDIDSNDPRYYAGLIAQVPPAKLIVKFVLVPGVMPDEIAFSPYINMYAVGSNCTAVVKPSSASLVGAGFVISGQSALFEASGASSPDGRVLEYNFKVEASSGGTWNIIHNNWQAGSVVKVNIPASSQVSVSVRVREKECPDNESAWYTKTFDVSAG
jgi:hypothetical protein